MKTNRVLAINPFFPGISSSRVLNRLKKIQGDVNDIPIGLLSILSVLEHHEYPVLMLDLNSSRKIHKWMDAVREAIKDFKPTIVLIPGYYTVKYPITLEIASFVKTLDSTLLVVTGGAHVSAVKKGVFNDTKDIDVVVLYEGEWSVKNLVDAYDGSLLSIKEVAGTIVRLDQEIVTTPSQPPGNLDELPPMNYGLLSRVPSFVPIITQRGCPFRCKFCAEFGFFGDKVKHFPIERTMREIRTLVDQYGVKVVGFEDSMFNFKAKYFHDFFEAYEKERFNLNGYLLARADSVSSEGLPLVKRLDLSVWIGVESASPVVLKTIDKRISFDRAEESLALLSDGGIRCHSFWIIGLPGSNIHEEKISMNAAVSLARSGRCKSFEVATFVPYPGTETYERRDELGIEVLDWRWERWGRWGGVRPISQLKEFNRHEIRKTFSRFCVSVLGAGGSVTTASASNYIVAALKHSESRKILMRYLTKQR